MWLSYVPHRDIGTVVTIKNKSFKSVVFWKIFHIINLQIWKKSRHKEIVLSVVLMIISKIYIGTGPGKNLKDFSPEVSISGLDYEK